jgi:hypothetical protein
MEHYRFNQTAGFLGSNNALAEAAGGGVDVYLKPHLAIRAEADAWVRVSFRQIKDLFR